jgi:hypothetical protein
VNRSESGPTSSLASDMIVRIQRGMSASPRKRTNGQMSREVRFVPIATERSASKNRYSVTSSARASGVGGTSRGIGGTGIYGASRRDHLGLMLAVRITLPHFSVCSTMILSSSAGEPVNAVAPMSASRAAILGSTSPALISLLSLSTTSTGVFLGALKTANALGLIIPRDFLLLADEVIE